MGPSEYGIKFKKLPPSIGGGISSSVVRPGTMTVVWPWESVIRFDTRARSLDWGAKGGGSNSDVADYVQTRASDGTEVALAVKVQYSITTDGERLVRMAKEVATSDEEVASIVESVSRAEVRNEMNKLKTSEFFQTDFKYKAEEAIRQRMVKMLSPYGIEIQSVNLKEHRFSRIKSDGTEDISYQEKINEAQTFQERTKREVLRLDTVTAEKHRDLEEMRAKMNREVALAAGEKQQAVSRGNATYEVKQNEAGAILSQGKNEVEGIVALANSFSGPGGQLILKEEIVKNLLSGRPNFVVMGQNGKGDGHLQVERLDANDILRQAKIFEGMSAQDSQSPPKIAPSKDGGTVGTRTKQAPKENDSN